MKDLIGKKILETCEMSFQMNEKIICERLALFVLTDDGSWYKIAIGDGKSTIEKETSEPTFPLLSDAPNDFLYAVKPSLYENDLKGTIIKIDEYLWQGKSDESCGLLLTFDNGVEFSLLDNSDCMKIIKGVDEKLLAECELLELA